ncbi:MAG: hypothetical protein AVDCRST_MAG17-1818, partial [uncultured Solirubrobacterales bacterium]
GDPRVAPPGLRAALLSRMRWGLRGLSGARALPL